MKVVRTLKELQAETEVYKKKGKTIGFVPTMGFLHQGHMSLIAASKDQTDVTIASIYVNPSQFNDASDFESYPRDEKADFELLKNHNCDIVFVPSSSEIESLPLPEKVDLAGLENVMEGKERPGHFEGVIEIVYRLFIAVNPDFSFFGEKDFQQIMVVQKMVEATKLTTQIVGCPIIREESGLAMSSRNSRLSETGKEKASLIYEVLNNKGIAIEDKRSELEQLGLKTEYIEQHNLSNSSRLFAAVWLEGVRLIDNIPVD